MSTTLAADTAASLHSVRAQAAQAAYRSGLLDAHRSPCSPQVRAHIFAIEAVGHALALLPIYRHPEAFNRLLSFESFEAIGNSAARYASSVWVSVQPFRDDDLQAFEQLKGRVAGLMALAANFLRSPTLHHVPVEPTIKLEGFPAMIDWIVFGIAKAEVSAVEAPPVTAADTATPAIPSLSIEADHTGVVDEMDAIATIAQHIDDWIEDRSTSTSDRARRRGSVTLFVKSLGLMPADPVTAIAGIDGQTAAAAFERLSQAVGSKWGTVAARLASAPGTAILREASSKPKPAWASGRLTADGALNRLRHAQEFVRHLQGVGVAVPAIEWSALEPATNNGKAKQ